MREEEYEERIRDLTERLKDVSSAAVLPLSAQRQL